MLDTAISIIDRLISLVRAGDARREAILTKHIDPLFLDLTEIHADYSGAFAEIALMIAEDSLSESVLREKFAGRARELEHVRIKFHALTDAYREHMATRARKDPRLAEFVNACITYFDAGVGATRGGLRPGVEHLRPGNTWYTTMLDIVEHMGTHSAFTREACREFAFDLAEQLDRRWGSVTVAYARARVEYAGSV